MHRWSKLFVPTLREAPADAEVASHKFLLRAGYIRQLGAGIYSYLLLANRSVNKIVGIVREEMDKIGQEFLLPTIHPSDLWKESGRWTVMGDNMFRLKDRKGAELCLGMTHEEVMTDIARKELRSYKQLPQIWYQIQTKFRDEPRPKAGLLRVRQFIMKDSYSFDIDAAGLDRSYDQHDIAYRKIFDRCGLKYVAVEADSGAMGGSQSQEFMVYTDAGEDLIVSCPTGDYAANIEKATSLLLVEDDLSGQPGDPIEVSTPTQKTIEEVSQALGVSSSQVVKSYFAVATYVFANGKMEIPVAIFLRGDHEANEAKLLSAISKAGFSGAQLRPMEADEIRECFGLEPGFIGPYGFNPSRFPVGGSSRWKNPQVYFDLALKGRRNMIAGANKPGLHLKGVTFGENVQVPETFWIDLRLVKPNDPCPVCGTPLKVAKAVEVGHIFKLGYRYSQSMGASVLDESGKEVMPIMGCYGIGIERILTAAIEQNNDKNGFWLPPAIAPFEVVVTITNTTDAALVSIGERVAADLEASGFDVILDDRDERAGVKFKDADLIGIPYRINVGKKAVEGKVEVVTRATSSSQDVEIGEVATLLAALIAS
jgi:prolyl-tRNA synthetase